MSVPNTVTQAAKALDAAEAKGAHAIRISTDLLGMFLNGHVLLMKALAEIEAKNA